MPQGLSSKTRASLCLASGLEKGQGLHQALCSEMGSDALTSGRDGRSSGGSDVALRW